MSEEKDLFQPSRLEILRETWAVLKDSKDLSDARERFKQLILNAVLGE